MNARFVAASLSTLLFCLTAHSATALVPIPLTEPLCLLNPNAYTCGHRQTIDPAIAFACPTHRWIGLLLGPATQCLAPGFSFGGTWSVSKLFPGPSGSLPSQLARFCIYEWTPNPNTNNAPVISALPNSSLLRLERDCQVVAPLTTPTAAAAEILESAYDEQIDRPSFPATTVIPNRVRVAVIDTSADEETSGFATGDAESHGLAIGSLIHQNSCFRDPLGAELGCGAFMTSYRALGPETGARPTFGFQSEVARAIVRAVRAFLSQSNQSRLIINLSLGWDARYGGLYGLTIRMPSLAVWLAVQWAVCEGALVIAAAGNGSSVGGPSGPMTPASWESEKRLCTGLLAYDPPVFAVGGVDGADDRLGNGRPSGQPRLVAPSTLVVSDRRDPVTGEVIGSTPVLTGTSLSAAGVSGVAAMAWSLRPDLSALSLMDALSTSGPSLGVPADFESPPFIWWQRRLDACASIEEIDPPLESAPLACAAREVGIDANADFREVLDGQWPELRSGPDTPGCSVAWPVVPMAALDGTSEPNAAPQPGSPTCTLCMMDSSTLYGQVDLAGASLEQMIFYPDPCEQPWCDPDLGGVKINVADPAHPFKVNINGMETTLDSAVMEIRARSSGELIVKMSPVSISKP